jgi:4-amino-4-deoxy-L-arabinose transferase-like glycosyltransferase
MAGVLVMAVFFRVYQIDQVPLGLSHDEAYNGQDAIQVLEGSHSMFFPQNNGREPLFIYVSALAFRLFGIGHLALRGVAVLAGSATVLLSYLLLRRMSSPRLALLGSLVLAICFPHILASRLGLRAILLPLLEAAALYFLWHGLQNNKRWPWIASGALTGLALYTYPPARFFPLVIVLYFIYLSTRGGGFFRRQLPNLLILAATALLVFAPLGAYFLHNPGTFMGRAYQVDDLKFILDRGDFVPLWRDTQNTLGMFSFQGDPTSRYNLAGRPVFDPPMSALFYAGILIAAFRAIFQRKQPTGHALLLIWAAVSLIPVATTGESPQFLRAIGAWPALCGLAAMAIVAFWSFLSKRWRSWGRPLSTLIIVPVVVYSAHSAFFDYFTAWANDDDAALIYGADFGQAARYLQTESPQGQVFLSARYVYDLDRFILDLLLGHPPTSPRWFDGTQCMVLPKVGTPATYLFPASAPLTAGGGEYLPAPVQSASGPDGSAAVAIHRLDRAPDVTPPVPLPLRIGDLVALQGFDIPRVARAGESLELTLYWDSLGTGPGGVDYVFFVHLVDERGFLWAQCDGGGFPTFDWRAGDQVIQDLSIEVPPDTAPREYQVLAGIYDRLTGERLSLTSSDGIPLGTAVALSSVSISKSARPATPEELPIANWRQIHFGDDLFLLGYDTGPAHLQAGEAAQITLFWQALGRPEADYVMNLILTDEDRTPLAANEREPLDGDYPTGRWDEGDVVRDIASFTVPADLPAGKYGLRLQVLDPSTDEALIITETGHDSVPVGSLTVSSAGRAKSFHIPPMEHTVDASFGGQATLLGYDLEAATLQPGGTLSMTLYWQADADMDTSYTVFTHLLDESDHIWGQVDNPPERGAYPTDIWTPDEVVVDPYQIPIDPSAPPGVYTLEAGLYDAATGRRLSVLDDEGAPIDDRLLLHADIVVE